MAVARAPVGNPDHEREALHTALGRMRRATGLPVAFGGAVSPGRRDVRLTVLTGTLTGALRGLVIGAGNGLGGRVLVTARPGSVDDYATDLRISHEYDKPVMAEGLRAIAAVPVTMDGSVCGVLYGGTRESLSLSTRVLDAMTQVALRMSIELTVRREVERRMAELETAAITSAAREAPTAPEWEEVRQAHAQLRSIAQEIADPAIRLRLQDVCDRLARSNGEPLRENPLSPRELDVLALVAVGCGNAETARRLGILPETVKSYLRNIMRKLGTHRRMETVIVARRSGFMP
ncbi:LuxR C-terminal-related transcriptional regulator [Microtetraspora sp. NBRC 16547]|uniref:helix-turn-helix transcriptional regulator n=1 Tax=Microtetraspora sp. NBRC 16547 TaxID=3030993 RepID=UPI0024A4EE16|nr:LuxR C-terminal-related transcriptional regulator [Microtetraspora sp. NBRC 16547]GLX02734.1 helix-turn-helix transcriptional regulator [Microtetraspora sp. NBRC 16547]